MKKLALLVIVVIIAICLLVHGCSKRKAQGPSQGSDPTNGQFDDLPDFLPEPLDGPIMVGYVLRDSVNVRSSASTDSDSVGKVLRGDMLRILKSGAIAGSNGGAWYEVRFNGRSAYIHADFLEAKEMSGDDTISIGSVVNVDSVLNIRAEPNPQSQKVGRANTSEKFIVLSQGVGDGSWTKIEYAEGNDGVAYIKSEYLKVEPQKLVDMLLE
jgi:uncharacterized protein YgiM (DUF1202 family)